MPRRIIKPATSKSPNTFPKRKPMMPLQKSIGISLGAAFPKTKKVIKAVLDTPVSAGKLLKNRAKVQSAYRNKNSTYDQFKSNWK